MGLDMYLYHDVFVGAEYDLRCVSGVIDIRACGKKIDIDLSKVSHVFERVAYWRKANAIHGWFVKNFAGGDDDCKPICVGSGDLFKLRDLCRSIMSEPKGEARDRKAMELLPPQEGFFFGKTKIDDWYYEDLEYTLKVLDNIPDGEDYVYRASW